VYAYTAPWAVPIWYSSTRVRTFGTQVHVHTHYVRSTRVPIGTRVRTILRPSPRNFTKTRHRKIQRALFVVQPVTKSVM
jgi:hypothetical protein